MLDFLRFGAMDSITTMECRYLHSHNEYLQGIWVTKNCTLTFQYSYGMYEVSVRTMNATKAHRLEDSLQNIMHNGMHK